MKNKAINFFFIVIGLFSFSSTVFCQVTINRKEINIIEKLESEYPDSAYKILKDRLYMARNSGDKSLEGFCLEYMGQVLYQMGDYVKSIENLQAAQNIFRKLNEPVSLAKTLNYLGNVYFYNGQSSLAIAMHIEALDLYKKAGDHQGLTETYGQIGFFYEKQHKPDSAIYFQRIALSEPTDSGDSLVKAKIYENLGSIMEDQNLFDSAMWYFQNSLNLNRQFGNRAAQIEILNNFGDIYRKTGDIKNGLFYTRQAMQLATRMQNKYQQQSAYWDMARSFKMLKQYDSALYYTEASKTLQHKIFTIENARQLTLMHTLFEIERKNAEILTLNTSQRLRSAITIAAMIICALLAMLAIIVINRQGLKIKNERGIAESRQKMLEAKQALMESELRNNQLEENNLNYQLELKSKKLSSHLLHLIQKNEVLETLKENLTELINDDKRDQKKQLRIILQKINISFSQDNYWEEFRLIFDQVHKPFFTKLQELSSDLSVSEIRLLSLIKMNLSPPEISTLLGITLNSVRVAKYRIKKKLNIGSEESLTSFVQSL